MVLLEVAEAVAGEEGIVTTLEMMDIMEVGVEVVDTLHLEDIEKVVTNIKHGFSQAVPCQDQTDGHNTQHRLEKSTITIPTLTKHSGMFPVTGKIHSKYSIHHGEHRTYGGCFCC